MGNGLSRKQRLQKIREKKRQRMHSVLIILALIVLIVFISVVAYIISKPKAPQQPPKVSSPEQNSAREWNHSPDSSADTGTEESSDPVPNPGTADATSKSNKLRRG